MENNLSFWGKSKHWWLLLIVGILLIPCGFFYWLFPIEGYAVASMLFGWMLIAIGVVQVVVGGSQGKVTGRTWWIIGGFLDITIGFFLIHNLLLAEVMFPYFLAIIFLYWGITSLVAAFSRNRNKRWWISLINGILLCMLSSLFIEGGILSDIATINFLVAISFIFWGFTLSSLAYEIRYIEQQVAS